MFGIYEIPDRFEFTVIIPINSSRIVRIDHKQILLKKGFTEYVQVEVSGGFVEIDLTEKTLYVELLQRSGPFAGNGRYPLWRFD